ncbi:MAG: hypothetical protein ACE5I5_09360 [Candidatus Heimdallarchaeota archaeon]
MSTQVNMKLQEIREQFKQDTRDEVQEAKVQGEKLIKILEKQIRGLQQTCKALLKDTESQIAKGQEQLSKTRKGGDYWRTVKLANELGKITLEGIESLELPEKVSYETLRNLANSIPPVLTTVIKTKSGYDPYITPYFIRARRSIGASIGKLQDYVKEIGKFTSSTYRRVRHIEKTLEGIDRLETLFESLPPIETVQAQEKTQVEELTRRIREQKEELAKLNKEELIEVTSTLDQEIRSLELKVFKKLRLFRDPLKKMLYRSKGGPGLSVELKEIAEGYMEHTLESFQAEELGHKDLSKLMQTLKISLEREAVSLKKRKEEKIMKIIEEILNKDILFKIQEDINELKTKKQKITNNEQYRALKTRENEIQVQIQELEDKRAKRVINIDRIDKEKGKKMQQIEQLTQRITQNIHTLTGKHVSIGMNV